jgi:hypothetical protein
VRATKVVVRPGKKNGGTTLVFAVRRPGFVRFTVVRVYPSCKRVGSFTVRARAGTNQVRFSGSLDGRRLGNGVYRLLAQVRGQEKAVATVTLVVARSERSAKNLRKARPTACSENDAKAIEAAIGAAPPEDDSGALARVADVADPVVGAVKGVARTAIGVAKAARSLPDRIQEAAGGGQIGRLVLTMVGLTLLLISLLGTLVLTNVVRFGVRHRVFR